MSWMHLYVVTWCTNHVLIETGKHPQRELVSKWRVPGDAIGLELAPLGFWD